MPFRRHDARRRPQAGGVHLSTSSASLSSFSSSNSSVLPADPPSNSSHSDIAPPPSSFTPPQNHLPPDTILPVPRSSSLLLSMGQVQSRPPSELAVPPPSPTSGGAGSRLKRVFGSRKKKSEDISPNALVTTVAPVPIGMGKSRSVMTPASSTASSTSAPKLPQQPSVSAGPGYPISPFTRYVPAGHSSAPPSKPLPESHLPGAIINPPPPSDQRTSVVATTPGVTTALSGSENAEDVANARRRPKKKDSDYEVMKEDWRKSDSTMTSYNTARPRSRASGGTRTPRPVSMAESLQSTNTVVPTGRRLSALLTEAEFIMTEEGLSRSATSLTRKTSPSGPSKTRKRQSISLSFTSPLPSNQPAPSAPSSEGHSSGRPAFHHRPSGEVATLSRNAASGVFGLSRNGDPQSTNNIRGNFVALSAVASPPHSFPHQPPPSPTQHHGSLRQTAITVTSGLAPAAGFAMGFGKRAVERMGRAFGNLGSGHNTSGHSSSSSSISGMDDFGRSGSNLSLASHSSQSHAGRGKQRRTPNAPSGAWSVNTLSSSSTGHTDTESVYTGPTLGTRLREPMRNSAGVFVIGGLVFGRDLKSCVRDTAIDAIRLATPTSNSSQLVSTVLHERRLPALVVRCAEHMMKWGLEEEGLFRISGRATHVAKLRSEFDNGADFDLSECAPSDLDPHAVASIFKTYLRELPEPILTHALNRYFEVAMLAETNVRKSIEEQAAPPRSISGKGPSLPSGPHDAHSLRKPPSLSTLALPNFSGMRPPSQGLLNAFASLLARLPQENRDLLRTVIDLINFVAQRKDIRMPLSNLTLVLCPTLNMSPPILRVLCEAEGIWNGPPEGWEDINNLDLKCDNPDPVPEGKPTGSKLEQNLTSEPPGDPNHQSSPVEPATGARGPRVERQAPSGAPDDDAHEDKNRVASSLDDGVSYHSAGDSRPSTPAWGKDSSLDPWLPPALTSSSDSLTTPSTSSEAPSIPQVIAPTPVNMYFAKENILAGVIPDFVRTSPQPVDHVPVTFPRSETAPGTPHRRSTNLPSLTLLSSEPSSQSLKPTRAKRPSLTALFSKRSVSSLRSSRLFSSSSSSSPYFDARDSPSRSSPASPRTPASISPMISAPSLLMQRSSSSLPPLLNTSIDSSSLCLAVGLGPDESDELEADDSNTESCALALEESSSGPQEEEDSLPSSHTSPTTPVTSEFGDKSKPAMLTFSSQPEPLQPQLSDESFVSVSSASSYRRLSLWRGGTGDGTLQDDWARNVLNDLGWSPTAVEHSMTGKA